MTNKPLDHETIARAMKEAAWIAKHGTRDQRAGRFMPSVPMSSGTPIDDRDRLFDLRQAIRDKWLSHEDKLGVYDTPGRGKVLGATDALWDTDHALRSVWRGLPDDEGYAKLAAYGLLQALVTQQDAVKLVAEVICPESRWKPSNIVPLMRIRTLRNRLSGHIAHAELSGGTASIIDVRDRAVVAGAIYGLPNDAHRDDKFPRRAIKELILANAAHLLPALGVANATLDRPGDLFARLRPNMSQ